MPFSRALRQRLDVSSRSSIKEARDLPEGFRESLSWIRMTRTAQQDARRSGKEDAGHSLFLEEWNFTEDARE